MNNPHKGARLTVYSREQIVARIQAGTKSAEVAAAFGVSLRTVRKWLARFRAGGQAALSNRASAPARVAGRLAETTIKLILHLRRTLRMTAAAITATLGLARSTVARWLGRAGLGAQVWACWPGSIPLNPCAATSVSDRASLSTMISIS